MSSSRTIKGPRGPSRGGIVKSRSSTPRVDKDGDLDIMGSSATGAKGRGRGRGVSGPSRSTGKHQPTPGSRSRPQRNPLAAERLQRAILNNDKHHARITTGPRVSGLKHITITGWRDSKAGNNPDGGIDSLTQWLERKASSATEKVKITKSRIKGNDFIISVRPEWEDRFLHLDGFEFAGAPLKMEGAYDSGEIVMQGARADGESARNTDDVKLLLTNILKRRYDATIKVLDLSGLGQDPDLQQMGILGSETTVKKFFPALMKMADSMFETSSKKREMVPGVTLAGNSLQDLELVTTLATTFPDLKNLDLSNNNFQNMDALERWKLKFRDLEHLIITGNPIDQLPETRPTLLKWYPKLAKINLDIVRSPEEVAQKLNPIPIQPPSFRDEQDIAATFLTAFFPLFDDNRDGAIQTFYDAQSNFSISVNTSAPRVHTVDTPSWDAYIKKSRNLTKVTHLPARTSRLITGADAIRQEWSLLPKTRHPSLQTQGDKWLIECHPIPGLPDPTGQVAGGLGGLLIMTHSSWEEVDVSTNLPKQSVSFDRTFVLGPGGNGGIRVISDIMCLRAFGGFDAFKPASAITGSQQPPDLPEGFGQPVPGKSEEQVKQEAMVLECSLKTRLTLELAAQCLTGNAWDMEKAVANFQDLKAQGAIPAESLW